jgi:hypothetical protein
MSKRTPLIIGCDFDCTIADVPHFPTILGLRKGAKYFVNKLYDEGHYIIINTCRTDAPNYNRWDALAAKLFLKEEGVKFNKFNENHPGLIEVFNSDSKKASCDCYIDDKNLSLFGLPPWWMIYLLVRWKNITLKKRLLNLLK